MNMRIAAGQAGFELETRLFPFGPKASVIATVQFQPGTKQADPLSPALGKRCVNRRPYRGENLPVQAREELLALVNSEPGASLDLIEDSHRKRALAALAARNDQILFENRALHDGLYRWLRWTAQETGLTGDGLPVESLELNPFERPGFRWMGSWKFAHALAAAGVTRILPGRSRRVYERSAAIGLLSISGARPKDFVRGGELLERFWLTATLKGIAFQPITGITFLLERCRALGGEGLSEAHRRILEGIRRHLVRLLPAAERKTPLMLFRLGYADAPTGRTRRRPTEAAFTVKSP